MAVSSLMEALAAPGEEGTRLYLKPRTSSAQHEGPKPADKQWSNAIQEGGRQLRAFLTGGGRL